MCFITVAGARKGNIQRCKVSKAPFGYHNQRICGPSPNSAVTYLVEGVKESMMVALEGANPQTLALCH